MEQKFSKNHETKKGKNKSMYNSCPPLLSKIHPHTSHLIRVGVAPIERPLPTPAPNYTMATQTSISLLFLLIWNPDYVLTLRFHRTCSSSAIYLDLSPPPLQHRGLQLPYYPVSKHLQVFPVISTNTIKHAT